MLVFGFLLTSMSFLYSRQPVPVLYMYYTGSRVRVLYLTYNLVLDVSSLDPLQEGEGENLSMAHGPATYATPVQASKG